MDTGVPLTGLRYIVPLRELRASDLPLAGGKAANLGELLHAGFPVPDGFCVTTDAFERFVEGVPGLDELVETAKTLPVDDVHAVRELGGRIRAALDRAQMPAAVADEIRRAWTGRDSEAAYAVRSSSTAEDLPDASFAGQQETILDVRGKAKLLEAVKRCWISLYTDRALVYRARNGFDSGTQRLAVAVQRMVPAEASGVLFTVDPVSQHRHTLVIDVAEGLGEALVGGQVTPDAYRVDRRDRRILDRRLADREGGDGRPLLDDARVRELADLGIAVEGHFGVPQDLEWAVAEGRLHLLQARPITSLYPSEDLASPDGSLHVYFSVGHQQGMTQALPPLSASTIQALLPGGIGPYGDRRAGVRVAGGRLYADLTLPLRGGLTRRGVFSILSQFDALAPAAVAQTMRRPEFRSRPRLRPSPRLLLRVASVVGRVVAAIVWRDLRNQRAAIETEMDAFETDVRTRIDEAPRGRERGEAALAALRSTFPFLLRVMPFAAAGVGSTRLLTRMAKRWLSEDELGALTLGLPGNVVNEMNVAVDELAEHVRLFPEVGRRLATIVDSEPVRTDAWREELVRVEGGEAFTAALDAFLTRYGARAPAEIDLSAPRWRDDPLPVVRIVAAAAERPGPTYRERVAAYRAEREATYERLIDRAGRSWQGRLRMPMLRRLYAVMAELGGMREHHKFMAVRVFAQVRNVVHEIAEDLCSQGRLDRPDDVWFVTWRRLLATLEASTDDLREGIDDARKRHADELRLTPPMVLTSDGEIPRVDREVHGAPSGALVGQSVSSGAVEGVVRVVRDVGRAELLPGEILVAEFTDPGWTPLFMNAAGLVLEVGGALTHGAVVAREYGIPAVVGVRGATVTLRTGQRVRVDGGQGWVEVLDDVDGPN